MLEDNQESSKTVFRPDTEKICSQKVIETDLVKIDAEIDSFKSVITPVEEKIERLDEEQRNVIDNIGKRLNETAGELTDDELIKICPPELIALAHEMILIEKQYVALEHKQDSLRSEVVPYRHTELMELIEDICPRIDYDAVFKYYRETERGERKSASNTDQFANTTTELYILHKLVHDSTSPSVEKDYYFYVSGIDQIKRSVKEWTEKGFIRETALQQNAPELNKSPQELRKIIVENSKETMTQLDRYAELSRIYKPNSHYDRENRDVNLEEIARVLDLEDTSKGRHLYYEEGLKEIDLNIEFLMAAERHIHTIQNEHGRAGRIKKNAQVLQEERERIDAIDTEPFKHVEFKGFEPKDGEIAVLSSKEIIARGGAVLPPDFTRMLRYIEFKNKTDDEINDDGTETVGCFMPQFGTGADWDTILYTYMEVYRPLFLPADKNPDTEWNMKSDFLNTVWHEFGHNAHNQFDYDEMVEWEDIMKNDTTAVTWYVDYSRKMDSNRGKREDFSDTFKLFISDPAVLQVISPDRYHFMYSYFQKHLQTQQKAGFQSEHTLNLIVSANFWKKMGYTNEDIREVYLN